MFKLSGAVEQWILGNSKLSTKKEKKKSSHSIKCIMTQLGNKVSVTPLNAATPVRQKPPNPLAGGGGHWLLQLLRGAPKKCLLKEHSHLFSVKKLLSCCRVLREGGGGWKWGRKRMKSLLPLAHSSSPQGFEPTEILWLKHIPLRAERDRRWCMRPWVHALIVSGWGLVGNYTELGDLNSTL